MLDNLLNSLTMAGWGLFVLFIVFLGAQGFQAGGMNGAIKEVFSLRVMAILIVVLFVSMLSVSLVFIEPQEVGVIVSVLMPNGYREQPFSSGLHWIVPLAERVEIYPIYWQNFTMSTEPLEGDRVGNDSIAARTSDGQAVYVDCSVIYRIDGNEAIRVHIDLQNRYIDDFIRPVLRGIVRTEVSQFTADEVNSSKRKNLEENLDELLRQEFSDKGFILDRFLLRNISFSTEYASAIEQKQIAEQERTQREYQAEQMRRLAEGERDRLQIEASGKATAVVLQGQAEADVIRLKAQAEAEAIRVKAQALDNNKDLITFWYVDKLSPGIRVMLVPNDNPYLLPLPDLENALDGSLEITPIPTSTAPITSTVPITPVLTPVPTFTPIPAAP